MYLVYYFSVLSYHLLNFKDINITGPYNVLPLHALCMSYIYHINEIECIEFVVLKIFLKNIYVNENNSFTILNKTLQFHLKRLQK